MQSSQKGLDLDEDTWGSLNLRISDETRWQTCAVTVFGSILYKVPFQYVFHSKDPCRANGLNCVNEQWEEREETERESEIKQEGYRGSVSGAAVALTGCLTISVTKPPFSKDRMLLYQITISRDLMSSCHLYATKRGANTANSANEKAETVFIVELKLWNRCYQWQRLCFTWL